MGMRGKTCSACSVLFLVFIISTSATVWSQDGICVFPSGSGAELAYPTGWQTSLLRVFTSSDTVGRGSSIEVWVDSDSQQGCPQYQWQVSGTGFHFGSISGPTIGTTNSDEERLQLWADNSACGSAVITVVDGCGADGESSVREPNYGYWELIHEEYCATIDSQAGGCDCYDCSEVIVGGYKYMDCWFGGTRTWSRYHGPTCTKWPYTEDLSSSDCGCPGFYYPFNVVGLYRHFKWKKRCN